MNIEDVKVGTRVVCLNDSEGVIPSGSWGTVVEDYSECPYISWDDNYSFEQFCYGKHLDVYPLELSEIEKLPEQPVAEKEIAKLTVSVSVEDKEEIAKDILKIVLKDLNVIISDAIDNLYDGVESNEPQTFFSYYGLSDEALRKIMDEVTEDLMKDCVDLNNTESSSMQTDSHIVTEDSLLANLLNLIEKATADGDLESLLNLTAAYQRMKSASTI